VCVIIDRKGEGGRFVIGENLQRRRDGRNSSASKRNKRNKRIDRDAMADRQVFRILIS
jgi:hypothetical protein